jgi:hypothetical protein
MSTTNTCLRTRLHVDSSQDISLRNLILISKGLLILCHIPLSQLCLEILMLCGRTISLFSQLCLCLFRSAIDELSSHLELRPYRPQYALSRLLRKLELRGTVRRLALHEPKINSRDQNLKKPLSRVLQCPIF